MRGNLERHGKKSIRKTEIQEKITGIRKLPVLRSEASSQNSRGGHAPSQVLSKEGRKTGKHK
jgi:hypothetical protein